MSKLCRINQLEDINPQYWNQSADQRDPFFQWQFLQALEQHGCVNEHNGWQPCHLGIEDQGKLDAFLPVYLKNHSEGEFVFDFNWANASQSAGIPYYPKLVSSIPFTPVTGPRLFANSEAHYKELLMGMTVLADETQSSSWHLLFPDDASAAVIKQAASELAGIELLERRDCHFVWNNRGYQCFDDFLQTFSSRKRKNIKKERRKVLEQGVEFEVLEGSDITAEHINIFYPLYQQTYQVRGRNPYLTPAFFLKILNTMPDNLILTLARHGKNVVGVALFLVGSQSLYGRWWGGDPRIDCLHFETCYYQGIDIAINKGLSRFDPGIQGEHKLLRGFEPEQTRSLHWIREARLAAAVEDWLKHERRHIDQYQETARKHLPYKKNQ